MDNVQVMQPEAEVRDKVAKGFRNMDNEQLVWVLSMLMYELNRRGMAMTD
jgi:hypothetical protein